jgi:hypothetical protein
MAVSSDVVGERLSLERMPRRRRLRRLGRHVRVAEQLAHSLGTTCHVQNDTDRLIKERSSTEEEMCMNGLTAWPSGSLYANTVDDGGIGCLSERAAGRMALRTGRVVSLVFRPRPDLWAVSYSEIFVRRAHLSVDLCGVRS